MNIPQSFSITASGAVIWPHSSCPICQEAQRVACLGVMHHWVKLIPLPHLSLDGGGENARCFYNHSLPLVLKGQCREDDPAFWRHVTGEVRCVYYHRTPESQKRLDPHVKKSFFCHFKYIFLFLHKSIFALNYTWNSFFFLYSRIPQSFHHPNLSQNDSTHWGPLSIHSYLQILLPGWWLFLIPNTRCPIWEFLQQQKNIYMEKPLLVSRVFRHRGIHRNPTFTNCVRFLLLQVTLIWTFIETNVSLLCGKRWSLKLYNLTE